MSIPAAMERLTSADPESRSADLVAENVARLRALFPEAFTEEGIDFDVLRELLGAGVAAEREERYGLDWHGKRRARQLALAPSTATLRPAPEESVDWEATQHLLIEGDNLEVLKLLQKSYAGRVKLIYLDPPYNTGNDFVYPDDFRDSLRSYQALTGQLDGEGRRVSSNPETSGRFHTAWMNLMYPRLKLARSLLRPDGVIFVSIDDHEVHHLRLLMAEIFGEENFVGTFVWRRRTGAMDSSNGVSTDHEYVVCYSLNPVALNGTPRTFERYANPDGDPRGPWIADNLSAAKPGGDTYYPIRDPQTGYEYLPPAGRFWPYSRATMQQKIAEGRILFPGRPDGAPLLKRFQAEARSLTRPVSTWIAPANDRARPPADRTVLRAGLTTEGTRLIKELFGDKAFTYAKPLSLLRTLVQQGTDAHEEHIVLDFFAGSGTTAHAVWAENAADGGNRRVILVQLPEALDPGVEAQKIAARVCDALGRPRTLAELTKERLRRAGAKLRAEYPDSAIDVGFRVFKLDRSNLRPWAPAAGDLEAALLDHVDPVLPGRTEQDVLYEVLLKLGIDLGVPVETREIAGQTVHAAGGGVLFACLAGRIERAGAVPLAEGIAAWRRALGSAGEATCLFRDSAFTDDVTRARVAAALREHGIQRVRSL